MTISTQGWPCPACGVAEPHPHEGWSWMTPIGGPVQPIVIPVTQAQRRVLLELTKDGADNRVIAVRLGCTRETVKTHIAAVLRMLPLVTSRTELAVALIRGTIRTRTMNQRYENRGQFRPGQQAWNKDLPRAAWKSASVTKRDGVLARVT